MDTERPLALEKTSMKLVSAPSQLRARANALAERGPLRLFAGQDRYVLTNSVFLIGNTFVNSIFGFLFWVVAARAYTPEQVGLGAAYISAATLLPAVMDMGAGTALTRYAPTMGDAQARFINSIMTFLALGGLAAAFIFALSVPLWSPSMASLGHSASLLGLFVASVTALSLAQFSDRLFFTFETSNFMLVRNLATNILRVAILLVATGLGASALLLSLGAASLGGFLLGAVVLAPHVGRGIRLRPALDTGLLRSSAGYALSNHFANLIWFTPAMVYPLVVVVLLGTGPNAKFYITWMVANLLFIVPTSVSMASFARASNSGNLQEDKFWRRMWLTVGGLILPVVGVAVAGPFVLRFFGHQYSTSGRSFLAILLMSSLPYTVNFAVITFHRITHHLGRMVWVSASTVFTCMAMSIALGKVYGLSGVALGWLVGQLLGVGISFASRKLPDRSSVRLGQC